MADSKRMNIPAMEAAVLGALAAAGEGAPRTLEDWLRRDGRPALIAALDELPWYRDRDLRLPRFASEADCSAAAAAAEEGRLIPGLRIEGFALRVLPESSLNASFERTGNKHATLFAEVVDLVDAVVVRGGARRIVVDRLGGRRYYADALAASFPFVPISPLREERAESRYRCEFPAADLDIAFRVKADATAPEVSLASMAAKYTRELLMDLFNRYWTRECPALRPTAGYHEDGQRFLADLRATGGDVEAAIRVMMRRR
ncbi:MAG: hypothetical protein R3F20_00560 [Planctomycetota bacterium]